jgi:ribosome-associated protein YbcJ (S4-like RNA binding protein)
MWDWYTLLSFKSLAEIAALKAEMAGGRNPKDAKVALAKEITARFHSAQRPMRPSRLHQPQQGRRARRHSRGGVSGAPLGIGALLKQANLAPSTSEANRLIDGGGVRVDGGVVSDKGLKLEAGTYVVQVGKRKFARVTLAYGMSYQNKSGGLGLYLQPGTKRLDFRALCAARAHHEPIGQRGVDAVAGQHLHQVSRGQRVGNQRHARQRQALAGQGGLHDLVRVVEIQPALGLQLGQAVACQTSAASSATPGAGCGARRPPRSG